MLRMQEQLQQRIDRLNSLLTDVRRNMEGLMAENQRLREVVRLAESELRNRRDQVQRLDTETQSLNSRRTEAMSVVEQAIARVDELAANINSAST